MKNREIVSDENHITGKYEAKEPAKKTTSNKIATHNANSNNWMNKLKGCTKSTIVFGSLCMLFFYWQQTGQMLPSAALPSMITCALLAGLGIGRHVR